LDKFVPIHLNRSDEKPLYAQIYDAIAGMIDHNKLSPGEKLPPIRRLCSALDVNSVTVVKAYKLLEENDYVISKIGSGTYVKPDAIINGNIDSSNKVEKESFTEMPPGEQKIKKCYPFDFVGTSYPDFFPVKEFKAVINEVLDRDGGYAFGYQEYMGYTPLREAIRDFILKGYDIKASIDNIQIVSGAQQGIDIIAKAFLDFQDIVFVESPTYTGAINAFKSHGAKIVEIPMEDDGVDIDKLKTMLKAKIPKLFFTMPNFHNPTGCSYSDEKKKELLALSMEYDFLIVEDDHTNDLFYDKRPLPLKSMDLNDRVFYIKSFSKPFMPGIRLAFILSSESFAEKVSYAKYATDIFSSGLFQRAMDLFIRRNYWQQNMHKIREIFSVRRDLMDTTLRKCMPPMVKYRCPQGGLFFWLTLPSGFYSMNLYNDALKRGILIVPGDMFYPDRRPVPHFRLSFSDMDEHTIQEGIRILSEVVSKHIERFSTPGMGPRPIV